MTQKQRHRGMAICLSWEWCHQNSKKQAKGKELQTEKKNKKSKRMAFSTKPQKNTNKSHLKLVEKQVEKKEKTLNLKIKFPVLVKYVGATITIITHFFATRKTTITAL